MRYVRQRTDWADFSDYQIIMLKNCNDEPSLNYFSENSCFVAESSLDSQVLFARCLCPEHRS